MLLILAALVALGGCSGGGPSRVVDAGTPAVRPTENQPVVRDPLATLSPSERVGYLQSTYAVDDLTQQSNVSATLWDNTTSVRTYAGAANGTTVTVRLAVGS